MLSLHCEGKGFQVWPHQNKTATHASLTFWRGCRRSYGPSSLLRNTENSERVENTFSLSNSNRQNTCRSSPSTALVFFEHCFGIIWTRVWYSLNNGLVFFEQGFGFLWTTIWCSLNKILVFLKGLKHDQIEYGFFLHKSNLYGLVTWELGQKKIFGLVWALYYPLLPEIFA